MRKEKINKIILRNEYGVGLVAFLALAVISTGIMFYHYVEKLSWIDATYFSVMTIATVGYGDIAPQTDIGKLFTIVYVLVGIALVATLANLLLKGSSARQLIK